MRKTVKKWCSHVFWFKIFINSIIALQNVQKTIRIHVLSVKFYTSNQRFGKNMFSVLLPTANKRFGKCAKNDQNTRFSAKLLHF